MSQKQPGQAPMLKDVQRVTSSSISCGPPTPWLDLDCSFRQTPVSVLRNEIEVSRDQLKLDAGTAAVKNQNIH